MTMTEKLLAEPSPIRFTRDVFHRLAEDGYFNHKNVELLAGEIYLMPPQRQPHVESVSEVVRYFNRTLPENFLVQCQAPLALDDLTEPEPDVAIVSPSAHHGDDNASTAFLVIEVANTSLKIDRKKASFYATAKIPEYWIINLVDRQLECFRSPIAGSAAPNGARYASQSTLKLRDTIQAVTVPMQPICVELFFPISMRSRGEP